MKRPNKWMKITASTVFAALLNQLVFPVVSYGLTSGPSQPEVQSFEPVGTTDMVDMFSGDFVYNIPLMDVEGYPVNISYHGGVTMEQEASWCGLGWNINPGNITHGVRGLPDDFQGDTIRKDLHIKDENTLRLGLGLGGEGFGHGDPSASLSASIGAYLNIDNYKGVSADFTFGCGVNLGKFASAGINMGVGSQTGASIDYNAALTLPISQTIGNDQANGSISYTQGQGYSSRQGVSDRNFSVNVGLSNRNAYGSSSSSGTLISGIVPISLKNYVPVITNSSTMHSFYGRIKLGGSIAWCLLYGTINGMFSTMHYADDGTRTCYGYLYADKASKSDILDFTRDKDGMFNKTMEYLPAGNMTYDIYNVCGQGTSGNFRPFRNDFGSVYDPVVNSKPNTKAGVGLELGIPWDVSLGMDGSDEQTDLTSGPWDDYYRPFIGKTETSLYEDTYFKQGGELTQVDPTYFNTINNFNPIDGVATKALPQKKSATQRDARSNLMYYYTGTEASTPGVGTGVNILSYKDTTGLTASPSVDIIPRIGSSHLDRKAYQLSEVVQVQKDGSKYVFGIPAMNNIQREAVFAVAPPTSTDLASGLAGIASGDDGTGNTEGLDQYYSGTITPAFAHSYLLTSVLSNDYVDVKGDGITDDDLGSFTKFNYTRKESDYRWRAPYQSGKAQYSPGFLSDDKDDKGSYVIGSREQWMLHSIETKNFVAEFYTSKRNDALGTTDAIVSGGNTYNQAPYNTIETQAGSSYKLDSIRLYNKHDRFINGSGAVPIKTVYFVYDYSLCPGVPNFRSGAGSSGKLTLKKIYMKYGNSERSMISPYQFDYRTADTVNYNHPYNLSCKDRWGNYKPNTAAFNNFYFPFVDQTDTAVNTYAGAWSLSQITLPSGGVIQASYESDDYAFVQDKPADEMFMVQGVGSTPEIGSRGDKLYEDGGQLDLYVYFKRRTSAEIGTLSFSQNYLPSGPLQYNFNVLLRGTYSEQIKGYATIDTMGVCPDNSAYGYIQLRPVSSNGAGLINPVTYTSLNVGRYNLPRILFPGNDPNESDIENILAGLKEAFDELMDIGQNPLVHMLDGNNAQLVDASKSFIRLQSPGLRKKGGGQRVKSLSFYDSWNGLAGGNEQQATYGKNYDYTIKDDTYGTISSGVASYEPMVGGDENPFRQPVQYTVQNGSDFPPNDPVQLYQEQPIGESLFPGAQVGYRQITVSSIHQSQGRSSQGIDQYQFYTAKDYPIKILNTGLNITEDEYDFSLLSQSNKFAASQGYSLIFNDMHGKPKSIEHLVYDPKGNDTALVSSQVFNYNTSNGSLDNNVPVLVYDQNSNKMKQTTAQLGIEADVTIDTREKDENTHNVMANANLNIFTIPIPPIFPTIPIPFAFPLESKGENRFHSVVATKVIQQYGILKQVHNYNEGAVTIMTNELYDPVTGMPVVTSINNEYQDKEYSVNIPAYLAYRSMGPSYQNIGYLDSGELKVLYDHTALLKVKDRTENFNYGDELLITYKNASGGPYTTTAWVVGAQFADTVWAFIDSTEIRCNYVDTVHGKPVSCDTIYHHYKYPTYCAAPVILPRYPLNTSHWNPNDVYNAHVKVIRSGKTNRLNENVQTYTMLSNPVNASGFLKDTIDKLISLKATTWSDSTTTMIGRYVEQDTLNPFVIGERGQFKVLSEFTYKKPRDYGTASSRTAGLFSAVSLWRYHSPAPLPLCGHPAWYDSVGTLNFPTILTTCAGILTNSYFYDDPTRDPNWIPSRTITKWSPTGKEVEDLDAIGVSSTAVFGYNEQLPVAVANNAKQGQVLAEGFEDYKTLNVTNNLQFQKYSPFQNLFSLSALGSSPYSTYNTGTSAPMLSGVFAHTGYYSFKVPTSANSTAISAGCHHAYGMSLPFVVQSPYFSLSPGDYYHKYDGGRFLTTYPYNPFSIFYGSGQKYILSYWAKPVSGSLTLNPTNYAQPTDSAGVKISSVGFFFAKPKSNVIDGWQQFEVTFSTSGSNAGTLLLPLNFYVDDVRIYPADANMKAFVYNPVNQKLIATLDENNFATFYEYDQEGNLVRTKKESEKGIMTISESRSNNPKSNAYNVH